MGVTDSTRNPSRPTPILVCVLFICYVPFSAKVKIPIILVAFFDVQWGRWLVHMEETGKVYVLPYPKVVLPRDFSRVKSLRVLVLSENE